MFLPIFLAVAVVGAQGATSNAPKVQQSTQESANAEQAGPEIFQAFGKQFYRRDFAAALATASKLKPDPRNKQGQAVAAAMRGAALLGLKRDKEAAKLFAEADELAPTLPYISELQFDAALLTGNMDVASSSIDRMIARFPDVVRDLSWNAIQDFLRNEPKGEERRNEDRRIALARLGYGGDSEYGDWLAFRAVEILMKRGDVAAASELLPYIDEPQAVENLLIQKRFSTLWPRLEQLAGPNLEKVRASSVASAKRGYARAQDSPEQLQFLANAFRHAGQLDEAIALRAKLPATNIAMRSADEEMGWAVNYVALALYEAGRPDDADQLFAMLNDSPIERESWLISMMINRLELLVADGRFDKALPLIEPTAKTPGSPYAQQLVRRLKFCTLSGLGRKEEATTLLSDLLRHAQDFPGATIDGLLCAGEFDVAEKLALSALSKDGFHEDFLRRLQAQPLTSDDPSTWVSNWRTLRVRPAIEAEFQRLGRDMPSDLLPPQVKPK